MAYDCFTETTAILVDGGFYRHRAYNLFGDKAPEDRAAELVEYCWRHLKRGKDVPPNHLYRIFYYDCPPVSQNIYHPLLQKTINLGKTDTFAWSTDFLAALASKRKVAIRLGDLQERESGYKLKDKTVKALCRGEIDFNQVSESDFELTARLPKVIPRTRPTTSRSARARARTDAPPRKGPSMPA